ncbi:IseA DL-endopeptidase inhibitor family protein [Alteromonas oceanisediminis]|uniref:IseA DL-endopeptidase inhibitor family protein n=1 Tax=Alteromonas oceanisediminis TaxID=2836180 RepID=UPI001BD971A3|nr:IseA DL-endopeptidase inhibitor family protein [Alteromonas oceanisediminis]MBT0587152.1 IseA DL-endopeptidase inhibitor family protein [Alteromonas oceanisediminis]
MKALIQSLPLVVLLLVSACSDVKRGEGVGKYGMMADNTPEYAAVMFVASIYRDENIDNALALSSERMARLLNNYRTNRNIQRHLFNLLYDTVEINPDSGDSVGRSEFSDSAKVTLFLSGYYQDDKIDELRTLQLIKEKGSWKVDKIEADMFL